MERYNGIPPELGPNYFAEPKRSGAGVSKKSPSKHEARAVEAPKNYSEILLMSGDELEEYVGDVLGKAEEEMFGGPVDAESKLIFIGGTRLSDISKEKTIEGEYVYKTRSQYRKWNESVEFIGIANSVIHEDGDIEDLASEAADIFYNLIRLSTLDTDGHAPDFKHLMAQFAGDLGWSKREALLVAAFKYHSRFIDRRQKDPTHEKELMRKLLNGDSLMPVPEPQVPTPTNKQINASWARLEDKIKPDFFESRLRQIRADKKDKIEGVVHEPWS